MSGESVASEITEERTVHFARRIEVRLAFPTRVRYEQGKAVKEPGPDPERVIALIQDPVTASLRVQYGDDTAVELMEGKAADVRLTGVFPEKTDAVKQAVYAALDLAFEGLGEIGDGG
ncbi:hypothetical protein E7T06_07920 [Deinococcus sp. Arct2-2]|uniref:hypothetical protein n=1 Tax=Deinococcus sp. Arct2-2 TaxID=2568653 RepID=UPI0010A3B685|nr:hypothetical protein [Deinococcus sp. Arct2-2]THF70382.1 hypothetical protein E7T06_07920 [Deinococcus sp. Arct2-2]